MPEISFSSRSRLSVPQRFRKRSQVARACDGCRLRRSKCDNKVPCSKCSLRGLDCSNSGLPKASTLSEAHDEIAWLKQRVKQLEAQTNQQSKPPSSSIISTSSDSSFEASETLSPAFKRFPNGIKFRPGRSPNEAWFGPSSLFFFLQRFSASLNFRLSQSLPACSLLPLSAKEEKLLDQPVTSNDKELDGPLLHHKESPSKDSFASGVYLSLIQEEYFMSIFWQTYHTAVFPIMNETHFKKHYQSLWNPGGTTRRPSALVDIMIAMCMQYCLSSLPLESQGTLVEGKDALVAGRWHYWRGQTLLTHELESPSLSTLQCHMLCSLYLCGGSFHNQMENSVSLAVRTAYCLGLHIDPPATMPEPDRELRRRLWWAVFLMDTKSGMKLGRPFMLSDSYAMPCLPSDSLETAAISGSTYPPIGEDASWLSFNLYHVKLYMVLRSAFTSFNEQAFRLQNNHTIGDDPKILQVSAEALAPHMEHLQGWVDSVPEPLRMKRDDGTAPFSIGGTYPVIERFAPNWLQRQRLLLELTYHHLSVNLYRPFISFTSSLPPNGIVERVVMQCAEHAIMLSKITQHIMAETSLLDGWHEAYYSQWNSALTLVAFVMAYPDAPLAIEARSAIDLALSVLDNFGAKFTVARSAAKIVRDLCEKIDSLLDCNQPDSGISRYFKTHSMQESSDPALDIPFSQLASSSTTFGDINIDEAIGGVSTFDFNMATDIDFWNDLSTLWPDMDPSTQFD